DRIQLNARDAGISLQSTSSATSDVRLVRLPVASLDPQVGLSELARQTHQPPPVFSNDSVSANYSAENILLQKQRLIPLLHLRAAVAVRPNVHGAVMRPDGTWNLRDVWLSPETP